MKRPRQAILTTSNRGVYTNKSQPHADNQRIHPTKADYPSFKKRKYSTEEKPKDEGSHSKDLSTLRDDSRYHSTHNRSKTIKNEKSRSLSKSKNATKHSNRPQPHTDSKKFYSFDDIDDYDDHDDHDDHDHYDDHNDYDDYDELFITDKKSGSTSREGVKKAQTQPHGTYDNNELFLSQISNLLHLLKFLKVFSYTNSISMILNCAH